MAMSLAELVSMREAATAQASAPGVDERTCAYHLGVATAVRGVLFAVAAGEAVSGRDIEVQLAKVAVRTRQPWSLRYCAYWDGAVCALEHLRDNWPVSDEQGAADICSHLS
ncbi:hypothetical protein [Mycolicibacterium fortuitum]|uniref:hypothetical protein n=1 Tax=Mycolicibacterium fortuitum TaxID=1766 RepID=UPI0026327B7B|nr:hypothetical protein [Mycolicibacterium fortuitum]